MDSSDLLGSASTEYGEPIADASPSIVQSPKVDDNKGVDELDGETVGNPLKLSEPAAAKHEAFADKMNQVQKQYLPSLLMNRLD